VQYKTIDTTKFIHNIKIMIHLIYVYTRMSVYVYIDMSYNPNSGLIYAPTCRTEHKRPLFFPPWLLRKCATSETGNRELSGRTVHRSNEHDAD
jgi:hypothetical protein